MQLPVLDFCNHYPTIGPTGLQYMNINGKAVSIELFYGKDVLLKNDNYVPIQWTGYIRELEQYQGSIMDKPIINKKMKKSWTMGISKI